MGQRTDPATQSAYGWCTGMEMETATAMNDESVTAGGNPCEREISAFSSRRQLHIAQVAPLYESVPPKLYGGTERVVSYLTEQQVQQGHREGLGCCIGIPAAAGLPRCDG